MYNVGRRYHSGREFTGFAAFQLPTIVLYNVLFPHFPVPAFSSYCIIWSVIFWSCKFRAAPSFMVHYTVQDTLSLVSTDYMYAVCMSVYTVYRVVQKTDTQFYFWDNVGYSVTLVNVKAILHSAAIVKIIFHPHTVHVYKRVL